MKNKDISRLSPPGAIGIVGGGQLGRMLCQEAKQMGYRVVVLDPSPDSPAGQVADEQIVADFSNMMSLRELAAKTDVITFEFEHIDANSLGLLEADGCRVVPSTSTLMKINNKYLQKSMLKRAGIGVPDFRRIESLQELEAALKDYGGKMVLKLCTGGYDGKGNIVISESDDLKSIYDEVSDFELMAEEFVEYVKEISIIVARNSEGTALYPVAENTHEDSILIKSAVPAKISKEAENKIKDVAERVAAVLEDIGVFCIELFLTADSQVLVNEIAPRPHNSGHYTIEGCVASQFEQLVRIMTGMPLGSARLRASCVMYNILGDRDVEGAYRIDGVDQVLGIEDCHLHLYGKPKSGYLKKIGHITVLDDSMEEALTKGEKAVKSIKITGRRF
ncbi:MAG: 5-(carboxyamino)imidazole ribonucleotide synthase [Peptoclostridium sp.]|uniref:5-(carboxyamino)imidazole ribonucleotide synthase n=1 Tax=Peptoclostridium sp. TaxID=1904860 RepID=UPI00139BCB20|nr:5-(carboxyamino)imidazole ribonucleotide synthase [Peptoclostridium sp.]MZQ75765.1 5-(carboxyamino)imidazole ribonucleotide synthase [Peptoclostridium sp.]